MSPYTTSPRTMDQRKYARRQIVKEMAHFEKLGKAEEAAIRRRCDQERARLPRFVLYRRTLCYGLVSYTAKRKHRAQVAVDVQQEKMMADHEDTMNRTRNRFRNQLHNVDMSCLQ